MSLLAKIASLRQVNINAHAEIEALKEDLDEFDWRGGSLKVEIDCLTQCLEERFRSKITPNLRLSCGEMCGGAYAYPLGDFAFPSFPFFFLCLC